MKHPQLRWLLLAYKVPSEPTRTRVGIWRRIKSLGAVYLQSGVCVLPSTVEHGRQVKLLQHEIVQAGGAADVLEAVAMDGKQEAAVVQRFQEDRQADYRELLGKCADYQKDLRRETDIRNFTFAELQENDEDLKKLRGWLSKIRALDFYGTSAARDVGRQLQDCERSLEEFARRVFEVDQRAKPNKVRGGQEGTSAREGAAHAGQSGKRRRVTAAHEPSRRRASRARVR
jgi:hypothetical protein